MGWDNLDCTKINHFEEEDNSGLDALLVVSVDNFDSHNAKDFDTYSMASGFIYDFPSNLATFESGIDWSSSSTEDFSASGFNLHLIPAIGWKLLFNLPLFAGRTVYELLLANRAPSDVVDRLNGYWFPMLLLFFALALSAQLFGLFSEPISCLESLGLKPEEMQFTIDYCQTKNLYHVSPDEGIPWTNMEREKRQLGYYHWVPLMMFLQALAFMIPNSIWNQLISLSGIQFVKFLEEAALLKEEHAERNEHLKRLAAQIGEAVQYQDAYMAKRFVGRRSQFKGSIVSMIYICIKLMCLANVFAQFWLLNGLIGGADRWWGYDLLRALVTGANWQESSVFPRIALCDVPVRKLGDVARNTIQCHLRINTYNEKVYLFIWWSILMLAAVTFCNTLYCAFMVSLSKGLSVKHLLKRKRRYQTNQSLSQADSKLIKSFVNDVFSDDGVLLFWFIETDAGTVVARELFLEVFKACVSQMHCDDIPTEIVVDGQPALSLANGTTKTDDEWAGAGQQKLRNFATLSASGLFKTSNGHPMNVKQV